MKQDLKVKMFINGLF